MAFVVGLREHYRRSLAEGISSLPEAEGLLFGDEGLTSRPRGDVGGVRERLSAVVEMSSIPLRLSTFTDTYKEFGIIFLSIRKKPLCLGNGL